MGFSLIHQVLILTLLCYGFCQHDEGRSDFLRKEHKDRRNESTSRSHDNYDEVDSRTGQHGGRRHGASGETADRDSWRSREDGKHLASSSTHYRSTKDSHVKDIHVDKRVREESVVHDKDEKHRSGTRYENDRKRNYDDRSREDEHSYDNRRHHDQKHPRHYQSDKHCPAKTLVININHEDCSHGRRCVHKFVVKPRDRQRETGYHQAQNVAHHGIAQGYPNIAQQQGVHTQTNPFYYG